MTDKTPAASTPKSASAPTAEPTTADDVMLAGVSPAEEKQAKDASKEVKDEQVTVHVPTDDLIAKLPDNGVLLAGATVAIVNDPQVGQPATPTGGVYNDEFAGQGGTFVVGADGVRRRAHEKVTDTDGKELGFRPIP